MKSDDRRRACRVDTLTWPVKAENVGDAAGGDGDGAARRRINAAAAGGGGVTAAALHKFKTGPIGVGDRKDHTS